MKVQIVSLLALTASILVTGCGKDDEDKTPPPTKFGVLNTSLLDSATITSHDLMSASCTSDGTTGLLTANFGVENAASLHITIKGFDTTRTSPYVCTQDAANTSGDVGPVLFNGCAVRISLPDATTGRNTYSMYRERPADKDLAYTGNCQVTTSYLAPKVTFTVKCEKLIQSKYQNADRNPIDPNVTATVHEATTANCNI